MLCTGPNWGPSRGAAGESGKSVVLRNWWSYCTVPRETASCAENSIYDEISVEARPVRIGKIIATLLSNLWSFTW
jgi:hypothetical protein